MTETSDPPNQRPSSQPQPPQQQQSAAAGVRDVDRLVESRTLELSVLSSHLQNLAEKEKSALARKLHDELGGLLTAAKMDLSWLQSRLDKPALQERLTQLGNVLDEAMALKRQVVEELRPSLLDHFGLPTALRTYVESTCAKAGVHAEVHLPEEGDTIPKDMAITLFRIVQEGLDNVIRHANAQRVKLELQITPDAYAFTLTDDGRGFDPNSARDVWPHGIMGMQHRVRALGGHFALESAPGRGTTLKVSVPAIPAATN